jgi:hypothetical protein
LDGLALERAVDAAGILPDIDLFGRFWRIVNGVRFFLRAIGMQAMGVEIRAIT